MFVFMEDLEENLEMGNNRQTLTKEENVRLAYITQPLVKNLSGFLNHLNHIIAKIDLQNILTPISYNNVYSNIF